MEPTIPSPANATSEELAGDISPLARALGGPESFASLSALAELVRAPRPESVPALHVLMRLYRDRLLAPVELPAIRAAYEHTTRGEVRELIALDRMLASHYGGSAFAQASRHAGRTQLRRLRPLRNHVLQRYLAAVETGEATGWHVLVFGILLSLFSLPLRQGLAHYAAQSQSGVLESASTGLVVAAPEHARLREECETRICALLQEVLPAFEPRVQPA